MAWYGCRRLPHHAILGMKHGSRDVPATWEETLSPPGTRMENSLERYDRLMGVI